jgi:hypothetical protein
MELRGDLPAGRRLSVAVGPVQLHLVFSHSSTTFSSIALKTLSPSQQATTDLQINCKKLLQS